MVETLLGLDEFDNITGKPGSDGIRDFAGEHFEFLCLPSFETLSREDMIRQIVRLLPTRPKASCKSAGSGR